MGLLDSTSEEPRSKLLRWIVSSLMLALLIAGAAWWAFRFYPEKQAAERFFQVLAAGDPARAYQLWHAQPSYSYRDFLDDWGPNGFYGPVRSYRVVTAQTPRGEGASGVIVVVAVSPFQPFPSEEDVTKSRRTKQVKIWVEFKDKSLGFPP